MSNKCANCKKEVLPEYSPFCSKRCADVDLGRWLNESYTIESDDSFEEEEEEN